MSTFDNIKLPNYEYDKYDIIDFLEPEYLEYLDNIPKDIWEKYKKDVENSIFNIKDKKIIELIQKKISIHYIKYIESKNFNKMNFELFKIFYDECYNKLLDKIKKNVSFRKELFKECILNHNLEFNKFMFEDIYINNIDDKIREDIKKKSNRFFCIFSINNSNNKEKEFNIPDNDEIKILFKAWIKRFELPKYLEVLEYYVNIFKLNNYFNEIDRNLELFSHIYTKYNIDNYKKLINMIKIFNIDKNSFVKYNLFGINNRLNHYYSCEPKIIKKICGFGNTELFIEIINNFPIENKYFTDDIITSMFIEASVSKNIDLVMMIFDYLKNNKIIIKKELYSRIISGIIQKTSSKHYEYDYIINEFINLGGIITGYGIYTEYIKSIKFLNKNYLVK